MSQSIHDKLIVLQQTVEKLRSEMSDRKNVLSRGACTTMEGISELITRACAEEREFDVLSKVDPQTEADRRMLTQIKPGWVREDAPHDYVHEVSNDGSHLTVKSYLASYMHYTERYTWNWAQRSWHVSCDNYPKSKPNNIGFRKFIPPDTAFDVKYPPLSSEATAVYLKSFKAGTPIIVTAPHGKHWNVKVMSVYDGPELELPILPDYDYIGWTYVYNPKTHRWVSKKSPNSIQFHIAVDQSNSEMNPQL
jgi:hypothetical protein